MPTVSLQDAMGTSPAGATPVGNKMRTPDQVDNIIQQMQQSADFNADPSTIDQMRTDLANGAVVNMPGLVDPATAQAHTVKKVSLADAFGGAVATSDDSDSGFRKVLHGITQPLADEFSRIKEGFNKPDEPTDPGRPMTEEEKAAWNEINKGKTFRGLNAKELLLTSIPGVTPEDAGYYSFGKMAKTLPEGYGEPTPEELAHAEQKGFSMKNPLDNFLKNNVLNKIISGIETQPQQQKYKYEQVQKFLQSAHINSSPDKFSPVQRADAKAYLDKIKNQVPPNLKAQFEDTIKSIKTDPGKFVSDLVDGLTADPELAIIPGASAMKLGRGVEAAGAAAKLGRVAARTGVAAAEGGGINAAIDLAHQSGKGTGGIEADELKFSAATGALMGGVIGGVLHRGAKAKVADLDAARLDGTLKDILKDQAAYDATVEAAVKGKESIPSDIRQQINDMLGITSKTDKEAYLKQRRADVRSAFKTDGEFADYLEFKANEAADLHARYQEQQADIAKRRSAEQAKQNEVEQAYSQTAEERRAQYQKDYEEAVKQKDAADLTDTHAQALAEDRMRTAQDKIDAEDAILAAHSDDLPAVKQAMAKIKRRNPSFKVRGEVDPELLARFGVTAAGATAGAYMGGPDHRAAGGLVGALAGLLVPAGGSIGRGIGGRERGVIGGRSAKTAHLGRLEAAKQMEAMGRDSVVDPAQMKKDVYYQTGWYRGRDGKWKFEIPDTDVHVNSDTIRRIRNGGSTQVKNVLNHPELWKAYPEIGDISIRFEDMPKNAKGHYDPGKQEIVLNKKAEAYTGSGKAGSLPGVLLHEINHIVQFSEGHARGGSLSEFLTKDPKYKELIAKLQDAKNTDDFDAMSTILPEIDNLKQEAFDKYRKLAGEVESRNVQTRYAMDQDKRVRTMPETTEDTPAGDQIVRFGKSQAMAEDAPTERSVADHLAESGHITPDGTLRGVILKADKLPNEAEVIARAQKGDQKAYSALYKQYFPRLERSVRSFMKSTRNKTNVDAEDIAQQAFIQAFRNLDKFQGNAEFYTWLYRIAQNEGLQTLRAGDSRIKTSSMFNDLNDQGQGSARAGHIMEGDSSPVKGSVEIASATHDTPEAMARAGEVQHQLEYAFSKLPDIQRKIVTGIDLEGKEPAQLAQELNISDAAFRKYLQRGRESIAASLEKGLGARRTDSSEYVDRYRGVGYNNGAPTEGVGLYVSHDKAMTKQFGKTYKIRTPALKNPLKVVDEPLYKLHEMEEIFDPITPNDSIWTRINKKAAAKATEIYGDPRKGNNEKWEKSFGLNLTKEAKKLGYDGFEISSGGDKWDVIFNAPFDKVNQNIRNVQQFGNRRDFQGGSIDPALLKKLAIGGAGAATGAYLGKDHKLWDAALGAGAFLLIGRGGRNLWHDVDHVAGVMSTRIKDKSEAIHFRAKEYYRVRNTVTHDLINAGHPFISRINKLPPAIQDVIERSILSGNRVVTDKLLDAVDDPEIIGSWKLIKKVIDGLGTELHDSGMIKKQVEDYFPRIVQDKEGLFKAMGKEQSDAVKQLLDEANRRSLRETGNPLSQADESEVINKAIAAFMYSKAPDSVRAGYSYGRRFKEIPPEFQKYYANLAESYHSYVRTAVKNIEMAKFFGKDLVNKEEGGIVYPDIDKSIGKYVEHGLRNGKITTDDVAEVSKMLRSAFVNFERGGNKTVQAAKNITMAGYLGNPLSAAMQITTPIVTTYLQGLKPTLEATVKKLTGRSEVNAKDFGLADHMSEEFVGTTRSAKFLREALKWGTFKFSDLFDKDIKLNSAIIKARDLARSPAGLKKLEDKYGQAFDKNFPELVKELKGKQLGDNTKALAYMELSRSDPIDPLEFSQFYADNPNGRNLLALKSYMMKQVDLIRRDAYNEIKTGNRAKGIKNLAALSLALGVSGMAGQDLKDVMLGRPIKFRLSDIPLNMLKTFGWSEYASRKAMGSTIPTRKNPEGTSKAKAQLFQTVGETLAPPIPYQAMDDLWNKDPRAVAMIPVVGRFLAEYYKNKNKTKAQRTKERNQL